MRLTLVNAGHPSAIIIRTDNKAEVISQNGDGLGLFDSISLDVKEIQVAKGDRVFLFSDGLIEQDINGSISRRIGLAKLVNLINENSSARIETTVVAVQENLFPALKLREMGDDAVFLGFEVT